ncbi:hypothetical protein EfmJHP38_05250 [Enterococcus faecium]|nr:hypothetical protein EfmJHP38_05250 [Enterococcus faecium]
MIQWSEDGTGHADFNLVAVYSDVETGEYLGQHVYFFGFQNGQPKVYLTQQNQGNDKNYMLNTKRRLSRITVTNVFY